MENKHDGAVKHPGKLAFFISVFTFLVHFTQQTLNYSKANMQKKRNVHLCRNVLQVGVGGGVNSVCLWSHFSVLFRV